MPAAALNSALLALHDRSLPAIGLLQQSLPDSQAFMVNISVLLDPRYVFLIYAPVLFALNKRVGHRMIAALTCCEWANQVLKWLLAGDRPYWYVHEYLARAGHPAGAHLQLRQFPVTCELGAGSPSGHAMVTATVWFVLIDAHLKGELRLFAKNGAPAPAGSAWLARLEAPLARITWAGYVLMLALVSVSRVYLACHFPHQCLCGALLGCGLAKLVVERLPMERLRPRHFALATGAMFATAMGTYALLRARGFDPLWSVDKALRWCERPEHIHMDTTPFYSMMRYLGFCLGAGLAYDAGKAAAPADAAAAPGQRAGSPLGRLVLLVLRRALVVCLSVGFGQLLLAIPLSRANLHLYYAISFVLYTVFAYSLAALVPDFVKSVLPSSVNFNVQTAAGCAGAQPARKLSHRKKISVIKKAL